MNGAETLIHALEAEGVSVIFGYPGGAVLPIYDALYDGGPRHILVRHEQGAALAADGYARSSGEVGVCLATSGPGATNLVTGIANAFLDSVPMVAITGNAPRAELGRDAFQEVDFLGITMPIVKHSFLVMNPDDIAQVVKDAFSIARSGRPGPVVIDIPKDVLLAHANSLPLRPSMTQEPRFSEPEYLSAAIELINNSSAPLVYGGGGIGISGCVDAFRKFVKSGNYPTVLTLKGLGALPTDHPLFLGMIGMHGSKAANLAVQGCDLLICIGARFDDRVTGHLERFAPNAKVIHLDIDPSEVGKRRVSDIPLVGELSHSLAALTFKREGSDWLNYCLSLIKRNTSFEEKSEVNPEQFLYELGARVPNTAIVTSDVGQHQMWVAQHYFMHHPSQHLSSGGLGTMGFGLPAAIGAQFACPDNLVVSVSGDGGIMMNIQELATIHRYKLPVKIVIIDNSRLGMVRQWQDLFLERRYSETDLSDNPNFAELGRAFQIPSIQLKNASDMSSVIDAIIQTKGPLLVHIVVHPESMVWPIVPPGCANEEMLEAPCLSQ